ncbi:hypothetical protein H5410_021229, partial [Solanum commersonii]
RGKKRLVGGNNKPKLYIGETWLLVGDFNSVLHCDDRLGGNLITWSEYTWNDRSKGRRTFSRIDCMFSNSTWLNTMSSYGASYLPE